MVVRYTFDAIGELFFGQQFGFMRDEHDYGNYIQSLDTLIPGIALSCVLPSYLRPFHSSIGMLFPTIRKSITGFDEIRAAGRYWTNARMEQMQAKAVNRVDLLDNSSRSKRVRVAGMFPISRTKRVSPCKCTILPPFWTCIRLT
jgi:hypothetical protein